MKRRVWLYAALALAIPLPALALASGGATPAAPAMAGQLGVQASLQECGLYQESVVCLIDATFNQVDGATSYTASVSRPDGSTVDYGTIGSGGSSSFWVPYTGDGTYTVQISAYGNGPGGTPKILTRDRARTASAPGHRSPLRRSAAPTVPPAGKAGGASATNGSGQTGTDSPAPPADGKGSASATGSAAPQEAPACTPSSPLPTPSAAATGGSSSDSSTTTTTESATTTTTPDATTFEQQGQLPQAVTCPPTDGSSSDITPADPTAGSGHLVASP